MLQCDRRPRRRGAAAGSPSTTPKAFRATTPSKRRAEREAAGQRGHGMIRFTKDFSRAFVDAKIEGLDPATIDRLHIR